MRKLVYTTLLIVALGCFAGASAAFAGDCCKPKCNQSACSKSCTPKCAEPCCKSKCDPCHKPKCETCKPKCESKSSPCKPKCDPCHKQKASCEPKCKQNTCNKCEKPKCNSCEKPKCNSCEKPKCKQNTCNKCEKPKCNSCEKPKCGGCGSMAKSDCGMCSGKTRHPYEDCFNGSGYLCDTGPCGTYIPCKRECVTCETVCKKVETVDPCTGCVTVEYVNETVCHELERPTVIPWWFNEKGDGNIYVDDKKVEQPAEAGK